MQDKEEPQAYRQDRVLRDAFDLFLNEQQKQFGSQHVMLKDTLVWLGNAYGALGDAARQRELLERKIDLVLNKQGSSTVIKGEAGTGKTHLLHQFVNDVIPKKTSIFCATASPFQRDVPYGTWATIIQAALDEMITTMRQPNRTAVAMELLETHCTDARLQGLHRRVDGVPVRLVAAPPRVVAIDGR